MAPHKRFRILKFIEYALDVVLLCTLGTALTLLACVGIYGHIPLPGDWINQQLRNHAVEGLYVQAESYQLHLNGRLGIFNLELHLEGIEESLLEIRDTFVKIDPWAENKTLIDSSSLVLSGGTLYLPASFSPKGERDILFDRIGLNIDPRDESINVNALCFRHDDIHFRGVASIPFDAVAKLLESDAGTEPPKDFDLTQTLSEIYGIASDTLLEARERYHYVDAPTILLQIDGETNGDIQIASRILSPRAHYQNNVVHRVVLDLNAQFSNGSLQFNDNSYLYIEQLSAPDYSIHADQLKLQMTTDDWKRLEESQWPSLEFNASRLSLREIEFDHPTISIWEEAESRVGFQGSISGLSGAVTCSGSVNLKEESATVFANGSLDVYSIVPDSIKEELPQIVFSLAPYYAISAELAPGWELETIHFDLDIKNLTVDSLHFDQIAGSGSASSRHLEIRKLSVFRDQQAAHASIDYAIDRGLLDIRAHGQVNPKDYSPLLPEWWATVFDPFTIDDQSKLSADFLVQVDLNAVEMTNLYGTVDAQSIAYSGAPADSAQVLVRGTEDFIFVDINDLVGPEGSGDGSIGISLIEGYLAAIHLDIDTRLSTQAFRNILGAEIYDDMLGFITTNDRPDLQLQGVVFFADDFPQLAGMDRFEFAVRIENQFQLDGIPIEGASLDGIYTDQAIQLRNIEYSFAGGTGSAELDITTPKDKAGEVRIRAELHDASKPELMAKIQTATAAEDAPFKADLNYQSADDANLSAKLHVVIPVDNMYQPNGYGWVTLYDPNLGTIQTLGPLSRILEGTLLNFSSFELDRLDADIHFEDGYAQFTEVTIGGPRMLVDTTGHIELESQALDLKVAVELFNNTLERDNIIMRPIKSVVDIFNPIRTLLRFEVTGTIEEQRFRSVYDPRNLIPENLIPDLGF
ncbi:AsmA-like C-terminal region-containing protein [Coraliomargarita akajimensis]|uniref:Uncharacterized protein n=1 Tax=Coraliomargarita akajimensis (strain DSM 45221 / IAM 15411 / JCM 23193 / KCTC 12865 / 04OKA010-24) TaxID=583355 RepID=D5EMU4_CORAD|nr:AsmA-like C-terminal region-containing protein [Coraliomargarita akajimensis]ADE55334.1 hypothetical protein Caka_2317 [Coraliomargarita akajimensis DSM 45221]